MPLTTEDRVAIAGAGRVAQALGRALRESGFGIAYVASQNPEHAAEAAAFIGGAAPVSIRDIGLLASHALIAVSDSAIEAVAREIAESGGRVRVALHTCGGYGDEVLRPLSAIGVACGSLHPLQTIHDPLEGAGAVRGIAFAIAGDGPAIEWAEEIARSLGGQVWGISPDKRATYHAAAVMASNYITALLDAAEELMVLSGVPKEHALQALAPMARTTVENAVSRGTVQALTGPIVRGDAATVAKHSEALERLDGSIADLYRAIGLRTLQIARLRGLAPESASHIHELLTARR